jgi:hypothetical protein
VCVCVWVCVCASSWSLGLVWSLRLRLYVGPLEEEGGVIVSDRVRDSVCVSSPL